ncbi:DNA (cytosine-5)-methyltransferase 3B [Anthophora retusa]
MNPQKKDTLHEWPQKSVWSLVCAMEMGLISDPFLNTASHQDIAAPAKSSAFARENCRVGVANASTKNSSKRTPLQPIEGTSQKLSQKLVNGGATRRRRVVGKATPAGRAAKIGRRDANDSTMDKFWKSCKRRTTARGKVRASQYSETRQDLLSPEFDEYRQASSASSASSKRKCMEDENLPFEPNCIRGGNTVAVVPRRKGFSRVRKKLPRVKESRLDSKNRAKRTTSRINTRDRDSLELDATRIETSLNEESVCWRTDENKPHALLLSTNEKTLLSDDNVNDVEPPEQPKNEQPSTSSVPPPSDPKVEGSSMKFEDVHTLPLAKRISSNGSRSSGENEQNACCSKKSRSPPKSDTVRNKVARRKDSEELPLMITQYHEVRRVTRGSTKISRDLSVGKLIWGCCSGWWPALIIDAVHVGMLSEAGKLWVYWIGEARISLLNEKTQIEPFSSNLKSRLTQNSNVARGRAIDATMQMLRKRLGCTLTKPYFTWIENYFSDTIEMLDEMKFYPYPPNIQRRLDDLKEMNEKVTEKYLLDQKRENQGKKLVEKSKETPRRSDTDLTRLPLKEQKPGVIAWAKIAGHNWWPAMIIDYRDCCMREPSFGCQWIMWYGDYQLSEVYHQLFLRFDKGIEKMRDYINNTKKHVYLVGVLQASKDYYLRLGFETNGWTLNNVFECFSKMDGSQTPCDPPKRGDSVKIYDKYSDCIGKKLHELKDDPKIDDKRADDIKCSDDLRAALSGKIALESLCLKCLRVPDGDTEIHPFFEGSLCKDCSDRYKPCMFVFGNDSKCFYCTVCAATGMVIICDKEDCPRVYCTACMKHLLCPKTYEQVLQEDPWNCFLCRGQPRSFSDAIVTPRTDWKDKIIDMFRTNCNSNGVQQLERNQPKRKIRVLSLFDGLSTGLLVLLKLGLVVDVYYASEIDPDALMVSASHFGDRIVHLGNVKDITKGNIMEIAPIDLLIGGSPCNDLSLANPARLGLYDPKGTGILFFEYCRILDLLRKINNGRHLFWMYENVASMPSEYRLEINKHLGQEPDAIDSADFSPQHRLRLYWHNLPIEPHSLSFQDEQDVQDILTPHCQRYALVKKIRTVTTKVNSLKQGKLALKPILMKDQSDSLWITELEEIFGFPRHYTDVKNLSATKRQRLIGKSWSVQTLTAILRSLCPFFECNTIRTE